MIFKPVYIHDCDKCKFIAHATVGSSGVDIYRSCNNKFDSGYIMRFSSEGSDYSTVKNHGNIAKMMDHEGSILSMDFIICQQAEQLIL